MNVIPTQKLIENETFLIWSNYNSDHRCVGGYKNVAPSGSGMNLGGVGSPGFPSRTGRRNAQMKGLEETRTGEAQKVGTR